MLFFVIRSFIIITFSILFVFVCSFWVMINVNRLAHYSIMDMVFSPFMVM